MTAIRTARRRLARFDTPARLADLAHDEFEGYASLFGVPDGAGDIVAKGAFLASLRRRPASRVRMLYQHCAHEPIGVWAAIREDARGLYVRGRLTLDVTRAREVRALIRDGALNGLSIGFRTRYATRSGTHRLLHEIELWEISVVTFPLLAGSRVTASGAKNDALSHDMRTAAFRLRKQTQLSSRPSVAEQRASRDPS
ncbi:MAG: HK97 family phage prohead protease [Alphaproteobacteria bacterium]|nr:HK97 family phage prohead protease [Alphaproteobacteria bacterium]